MITITRRLAANLKAVLRRAFGARGHGPAVCFTAAAGALTVKASSHDIAVEYSEPGDSTADAIWLPFQFLDDCAGKQDEPVHVESGKKHVTAQWRDGSVPQLVRYDAAKPRNADSFPVLPETFAENSPGILQALADAGDTCDPDSVRFALGHLQLRGKQGTIVATDGRQLLVQNGFQLPWDGDILVPHSKVFASAELPHDQPVRVGKTGDWVAISVGRWVIYLAVNVDGRFPDVLRHIPQADAAKARCSFSQADAKFLVETLPRLPCNDDYNRPVTLDLNGQIAVRAKGLDNARPTEVVLTQSSRTGEPIRLNVNRLYLARALRLGLRDVLFTGDQTAILGFDATRQYVLMPLESKSAIPPAKNAIRIESPGTNSENPAPQPQTERKVSPVPEPITNSNGNTPTNGHAKTNGRTKHNGEARNGAARKPGQNIDGLIRQAEALRTSLRDTLLKNKDLLNALKQHRRQNRAVQSTLASLRQLKTLGV